MAERVKNNTLRAAGGGATPSATLPHRLPQDTSTAEEFVSPYRAKKAALRKRFLKRSKKQKKESRPKSNVTLSDVIAHFSREDLQRAISARRIFEMLERRRKKADQIRLSRARLESERRALARTLKEVERAIRGLEAQLRALQSSVERKRRRRPARRDRESHVRQRQRDRAALDRLPPMPT